MGYRQCTQCGKWYNTDEFVSCRITDCSGYQGTPQRAPPPLLAVDQEKPVTPVTPPRRISVPSIRPYGGSAPQRALLSKTSQPQRAVIIPPPRIQRAVVIPAPPSKEETPKLSKLPECSICYDDDRELGDFSAPCCSYHLCTNCSRRFEAVFFNTGSHLQCANCHRNVADPKIYQGRVHAGVVETACSVVEAHARKRKAKEKPTLSPIERAWRGLLLCPHCGNCEYGFGSGCDIMTCPGCRKQYNAIDGSPKMTGLTHSFKLEGFYAKVASTTERSSYKLFLQLKKEYPRVWANLYLDKLLELLEQARGDEDRVAAVLARLGPVLAPLRAMLMKQFK